jgi:hypothetical protein
VPVNVNPPKRFALDRVSDCEVIGEHPSSNSPSAARSAAATKNLAHISAVEPKDITAAAKLAPPKKYVVSACMNCRLQQILFIKTIICR